MGRNVRPVGTFGLFFAEVEDAGGEEGAADDDVGVVGGPGQVWGSPGASVLDKEGLEVI